MPETTSSVTSLRKPHARDVMSASVHELYCSDVRVTSACKYHARDVICAHVRQLYYSNLLTFYKHLHTLVIPFENRFYIVVALPLMVNACQFNLFSALSMPPDLNLTIQYALKNSQIAISLNRKYYAFISTSESSLCHQTPICARRSPMFAVHSS